jgi:hypothetical protein
VSRVTFGAANRVDAVTKKPIPARAMVLSKCIAGVTDETEKRSGKSGNAAPEILSMG